MATVQITTWDEFKTALTETITEATTYEIMNDIDVSGEIITSTINANCAYNKTFKPATGIENVKINGITSYASLTNNGIIKYYSGGNHLLTFNNIHFSNFQIAQCSLIGTISITSGLYGYRFNNCLFNGVCYSLYSGNSSSREIIQFNYCSINIQAKRLDYSAGTTATYQATMTNCYIIFNPLDDVAADSGAIWRACTFIDCYIGGKIKINYNTTNGLFGNYYSVEQRVVFNADVIIANYSSSTTYYISNTAKSVSAANTCIFNKDRIFQADGTTQAANVAGLTNWNALTDAQMKSKTYIQENTNFPLYG